ncbi:TIR domain-containing protein [Cytobacillus pseudoceanisediminis]|uniref:TIR domain-containing protein n=1 Tax=Cytobacillus pseudoceanisediminis TaxID=3051614 RepID=UPI0036574998
MAYRNGVYCAFDGQGTTNPTESDIRYYNTLKMWSTKEDFSYINSHEKTRAVRDKSKAETLKTVLRQRLANSKVVLIILSEQTNFDRGFLNYEIEKAIDTYKLPIIIAYTGIESPITNLTSKLKNRWPKALDERLNDSSDRSDISCLHIRFKKEDISRALKDMSVHNKKYIGKRLVYN